MGITKYPTFSGSGTYDLQITAAGSTHTKGSYTQIVASTPEAACGLLITVLGANSNFTGFLLDIATGAVSSEVDLISNVVFQPSNPGNTNGLGVFIPINIAAGTRLSARCQATASSAAIGITVTLVGGTSSATAATYGANTTTSHGTVIDPGGTAHTKGSYVQLTPSTSAAIDWLLVLATCNGNTGMVSASYSIDIATGGSGSETVVVPNLTLTANSQHTIAPRVWGLPVSIPSGTRIAARMAATTNDATDRLLTLEVIGITNSGITIGSGSGGGAHSYAFIG